MLDHQGMFDAYPDTANIQSSIAQGAKGPEYGSYSNDGPEYSEFFPQLQASAKNVKSPVLHELQHAIQQREGWARGGSPDSMRQVLGNGELTGLYSPEELNNAYLRLAGEAEARLTQNRMNMNMDERLASYPYDMLDVPMDQLIVRGLLR
jgi:hypothetical protein